MPTSLGSVRALFEMVRFRWAFNSFIAFGFLFGFIDPIVFCLSLSTLSMACFHGKVGYKCTNNTIFFALEFRKLLTFWGSHSKLSNS